MTLRWPPQQLLSQGPEHEVRGIAAGERKHVAASLPVKSDSCCIRAPNGVTLMATI